MLIVIKMTYFTLTTMTTIGFGDFHPRTNIERIFVTLFFLLGTGIFSYAMNNFMEMIETIQQLDTEVGYTDQDLARFFSVLRRFNNEK